MSVREYVGARYVPLFVGAWDNTKTYEPLSVVTYQGASYTSRQYVPTGIAIDNEQYWILSANYDAQVQAYREEVQAFDERITSNATDIATNTASIATNTTNIATNTTNIAKLSAKKKFVVIGDSFSASTQSATPLWSTLVANVLGYDLYSTAVDGAGFTVGTTFLTQLQTVIANVAPDEVGEICVYGSLNDTRNASFSSSNFASALSTFCIALAAAYPNAKVVLMGPNDWQNMQGTNSVIATTWLNYRAGQYGFAYYNTLGRFNFIAGHYQADNYHPSKIGEAQIASFYLSGGKIATTTWLPDQLRSDYHPFKVIYKKSDEEYEQTIDISNVIATPSGVIFRASFTPDSNFDNTTGYIEFYLPCNFPAEGMMSLTTQASSLVYGNISQTYSNIVSNGWANTSRNCIRFNASSVTSTSNQIRLEATYLW